MIIKEWVKIPYLNCERMLHIYVPDVKKQKKLPVLYMFDGHNLFYDEDATYGKSWGIKEYLDKQEAQLIVVGIECSHEGNNRMSEFSPYSFDRPKWGKVEASGQQFFNWIIEDLKPYIDEKFPTYTDAKHTYVAGSSMGGLMAVYGGVKHHDVFSKSICVSTAFGFGYALLMKDIHAIKDLSKSQFYFSFGEYEANDTAYFARMVDMNLSCSLALQQRGAKTFVHCMMGGYHNEASWEKELPMFFNELEIL